MCKSPLQRKYEKYTCWRRNCLERDWYVGYIARGRGRLGNMEGNIRGCIRYLDDSPGDIDRTRYNVGRSECL